MRGLFRFRRRIPFGGSSFLQFALAEVAGVLRRGAAQAKEWSEGEVAFSDLAPEDLGLDAIWETFPGSPAEQPEETLFTTRSGKVVGKMELVALALDDERRPMVARLFGMDTDDPALRLMVLKAIDYIEAQMVAGPTWIEETPEAEPVVKGALDPIAVIRNGVQETIGGEELAQMVNRASDNVPMWIPDEFVDYRETDSTWPSWLEGEENRAYRSPYADDAAWPKSVTRKMWAELVAAWKNVGDADQVFAAMVGGECELSEDEQRVLVLLENLAGVLSEETDGSARTVASALANKVHALGVRVKVEDDQTPQEVLRDTFAWFLSAEVGGWEYELPTADGLRRSVEEWVGRACNAKGVWPSQAAAIQALVLYGASPVEARAAAQAAFSAR